jgi:NAD(P)H dehydrogenase (quinone)
VLAPFIAYGVEGGLRYSDEATVKGRLQGVASDFCHQLADLDARPTIPFNRMAEWGADGRIKPNAPAYSPFVRHRKILELG